MYAAYNGQSSTARTLLDHGAPIATRDGDGWDATLLALSQGAGAVAEELLARGAVMPAGAVNGLTPLMHAVHSRDLGSVRLVLETSPDLETLDGNGWTALEMAAHNGDSQILMELLRAGANASFRDREGKTALDRARARGHDETAALLGGSWNAPRPKGGTNVSIPCPILGGDVLVNYKMEGDRLAITTIYPKPVSWYLGGGLVNRAASAQHLTYEGTIAPEFHFDIDDDATTGRNDDVFPVEAAGSEVSIILMEYGTSRTVSVQVRDKVTQRTVSTNALDVALEKEGETVMHDDGDSAPSLETDGGVVTVRIPLSSLSLQRGAAPRTVAQVGSCKAVTSKLAL